MTSERVQSFRDGVFAFVITFLFLDVKPPDAEPTMALLYAYGPRLAVFVLSFWIVGTYWVAHHVIISFARHVDRRLLYLNLLLLLPIVLIPLATKMLAKHPVNLVAIAAYATVLSLANLTATTIWLRTTRDYKTDSAPRARRNIALIHGAPIFVYAVGVWLGAFAPPLALVLFICVPAFFSLPNPWLEKHARVAFETLRSDDERSPASQTAPGIAP